MVTDRERAALAVVREVWPGAYWDGIVDRTLVLPNCGGLMTSSFKKGWLWWTPDRTHGYHNTDYMRAVLRALDILNGVSDE